MSGSAHFLLVCYDTWVVEVFMVYRGMAVKISVSRKWFLCALSTLDDKERDVLGALGGDTGLGGVPRYSC